MTISLFYAQALANTIYGLAILGVDPGKEWMAAFYAAANQRRKALTGQSLSAVLWALLKLKQQPPPELLDALCKHAHAQVR